MYSGGPGPHGIFFEIDPVTNIFEKKFDFNGVENGSFSSAAYENYLCEANGKIIGLTALGGTGEGGVLFEWDPLTETYTRKINFNRTEGYMPSGGLVQAENGKFYGTTRSGGKLSYDGVFFEWDQSSNIYTVKLDFRDYGGEFPVSLTKASNGKLYGLANSGGLNYKDFLFEWDPLTKLFTRKLDLNYESYYSKYSLVEADNGKLYGISGKFLYEWDPITNAITNQSYFTGNEGTPSASHLIKAANNKLYGINNYGGSNNLGILYEYNVTTHTYKSIMDFGGSHGSQPVSSLAEIINPECNTITTCDSLVSPSRKYTWRSSGIYRDTISGSNGNDSILIINLIVEKTRRTSEWTVCDSAVSPSGRYTWKSDGVYYDTLINGSVCNKMLTIILKIVHPTFSRIDVSACESYRSPSGKYIWTSSGKYADTIPNRAGCDSIITVNLLIRKKSFSTIYPKSCGPYTSPSGKYTWENSGFYFDVIPNAAGCDSQIYVHLQIEKTTIMLNETACGSLVSPSGRYIWKSDGIYVDTIPNKAGCDSVIFVNLHVIDTKSTINVSACGSYTSPSGRYTWNQSGFYTDTIPSHTFCDSIIFIKLRILETRGALDTVSCNRYISPSGRYEWTTNGTYYDTLQNAGGCDSIITIHLTVNHINTNVIQEGYGLQAVISEGTYQWINCADNSVLAGETRQSFTARTPGNFAVIISDNECTDTSGCYTILATAFQNNSSGITTLYPNPSAGSFTIDLGQVYPETRVTITSPRGEKILQEKFFNTDKIKLSEAFPPGLYFITVNTGDGDVVLKVVTSDE